MSTAESSTNAVAKLRAAWRHAERAAHAAARARQTTERDLQLSFLMQAEEQSNAAMAAIEEAARLCQDSVKT